MVGPGTTTQHQTTINHNQTTSYNTLVIIMDFSARPTRNFWDIFHCCRHSQSNDEDDSGYRTSKSMETYAFTPMKLLTMEVIGVAELTNEWGSPQTQPTTGKFCSSLIHTPCRGLSEAIFSKSNQTVLVVT